ncbi:hypothetical protein PAHAL_4G085600 [Panicum hallii]|uniref:Uncharacterized protein n=1 Tax=Panicum hallii TaxID=206008 RepID=A0A2S3HHZ5_9POAL|nr:hypothetical protein PAHAL_4G085600 [Panicum hallii]
MPEPLVPSSCPVQQLAVGPAIHHAYIAFWRQKIGRQVQGKLTRWKEYVHVERSKILGCFAPCLSLVFKIQNLVDFIFIDNASGQCKVPSGDLYEVLFVSSIVLQVSINMVGLCHSLHGHDMSSLSIFQTRQRELEARDRICCCLTQRHMSLLVGNDGVQVDVMIDCLIWGLRHSIQGRPVSCCLTFTAITPGCCNIPFVC